jgi:hypothetical protein
MSQSKPDLKVIITERGASYGDFTVQGVIAQDLKSYLRALPNWERMEPHQRESMEMILHKISRIMNGDPNHLDSWVDIAGYAQIVADRIGRRGD